MGVRRVVIEFELVDSGPLNTTSAVLGQYLAGVFQSLHGGEKKVVKAEVYTEHEGAAKSMVDLLFFELA